MANANKKKSAPAAASRSGKSHDMLALAEQRGLLRGTRTRVMRGRMPEALVARAKARTGVKSDTELIELALVNLAVADDYPEWLLAQRASVNQDVDLEF
jgi:hypothetical protein